MSGAAVLPPGTQLQLMYLRERLRRVRPGRFVEIGPGGGDITRLLLDMGWRGRSYDLDAGTVAKLTERFATEVAEGAFQPVAEDFVAADLGEEKAELIISCMVMEHLDEAGEAAFVQKSLDHLSDRGLVITIVPGSPRDWGIEDDIAGHFRRYTREDIELLATRHQSRLGHVAGLTYPLSNVLLPVSNALIRKAEQDKLKLSMLERTKASGRRNVRFKTHFPSVAGLVLNRYTLLPFHFVQKRLSRSSRALVLYFELGPAARDR